MTGLRGPHRRNFRQSGMSLIEILVVLAIMTVTLSVLASVFQHQQRLSAQMADRLATLDVSRTLTGALADGNVCTFMVANMPPYTFNPVNLASVRIPPFPFIPSRAVAGATSAVVADGATLASPNSPRLVVNTIRIDNVSCAVATCATTTNQFNANLVVIFDQSKTAGPVPNLIFPIVLSTTGPAGAQTIATCKASGSGGGGTIDRVSVDSGSTGSISCTGGPLSPNCPAAPAQAFATCPAGYQVSGCGYGLASWPTGAAALSGDATPADDYVSNAPAVVMAEGNACKVVAGNTPGCGACFTAQAVCIRIQ